MAVGKVVVQDTEDNLIANVDVRVIDTFTKEEVASGITDKYGKIMFYVYEGKEYLAEIATVPEGYMCYRCSGGLNYALPWTYLKISKLKVATHMGVLEAEGIKRVGETAIIGSWLEDAKGFYVIGAEVKLYRNDIDTEQKAITGKDGIFFFYYTFAASDVPYVTFKAKFEGSEGYKSSETSLLGVSIVESEKPPGNGPACPIACVCMGTPLIDQLGPIREFRDEVLKRSRAGLIFVSLYYGKLSPHLSPLLEKSEMLRRVGRILVRGILWIVRK